MILELLDKDGTKNLKNVLMYLNDPETLENEGIKTKLNNKKNRKNILINSFKNLNDQEKNELIKYIKDKQYIVSEYIYAFTKFSRLKEKIYISSFLSDLMTNLEEENIKIEIFNLIFTNDSINALNIMFKTKSIEFKERLHEVCISLNLEKGYIYGILNNIKVNPLTNIDYNKLLNETNEVQYIYDKLILEDIMNSIHEKEEFVNEINKKIELEDFKTFYMLSRNIKIVDSYQINVNKKELSILKWIVENSKLKQIDNQVLGETLSEYSDDWLIFISINLLKLDYEKQRFSILILNEIINRKNIKKEKIDELAKEIINCIKKIEAIRKELFNILTKLNTLVGFYEIIEIIEIKGFPIIKKDNMINYINFKVSKTDEFIWYNELKKTNKYFSPKKDLNTRVLTLILMESTIKEAYDFLVIMKDENKKIYSNIMDDFTKLIMDKIDPERYMKLIIMLEYRCKDKIIVSKIEKYHDENIGSIKSVMKVLDPELLEKYYIGEIMLLIKENKNIEAVRILENIKDLETKKNCSLLIVEELVDDRLNDLIFLWEKLELSILNIIEFREKLTSIISKNRVTLTDEVILFADEVGIGSMKLFKLLDNERQRGYLLNLWYKSNQSGKIIEIIKSKIKNGMVSMEDVEYIEKLIDDYSINDSNLDLLIKINAYNIISMELLQLDIDTEETTIILNDFVDKLDHYELINRFLMDEFIRKELDSNVVNYMIRRLIENVESNDLLKFYWEDIISDINNEQYILLKEKMNIFFTSISKSRKRIEWFVDTVENINYTTEISVNIYETLLNLLNEKNIIIAQNRQEIESGKEKLLNDLGNSIGKTLSNLEKTIISNSKNLNNDVLIESIKKFRRSLDDIGIGSVEEIESYGKLIKNDVTKGKYYQFEDMKVGVVDSLGIDINGDIIEPATLLKTD